MAKYVAGASYLRRKMLRRHLATLDWHFFELHNFRDISTQMSRHNIIFLARISTLRHVANVSSTFPTKQLKAMKFEKYIDPFLGLNLNWSKSRPAKHAFLDLVLDLTKF